MDLCRGSLLAQIWTDTDFLTPPERRQLADFIALLKANPDCFDNSRFILGNPWKSGPYGYCCTNGKRAFVAIHNACLKDSLVTLRLGPAWGLPDADRWDVYRWYPQPAKFATTGIRCRARCRSCFGPTRWRYWRPCRRGESPSLGRTSRKRRSRLSLPSPARTLGLECNRGRSSAGISSLPASKLRNRPAHRRHGPSTRQGHLGGAGGEVPDGVVGRLTGKALGRPGDWRLAPATMRVTCKLFWGRTAPGLSRTLISSPSEVQRLPHFSTTTCHREGSAASAFQ